MTTTYPKEAPMANPITFTLPAGRTVGLAGPVTVEVVDQATGRTTATVAQPARDVLHLTGVAGLAFRAELPAGCLPVGAVLPGVGRVEQVSLTAYRVGGVRHGTWLPFQSVHGRPAPAQPLVVLG